MGKIVKPSFSNISYYQGNGGTSRDAIAQFSTGSWVEWGSSGDGSYYIGKIRVKLSNLSLPSELPAKTIVRLNIKSRQDYCGAGSLRGYITQTNFSNISEICKLTDGVFAHTANFKNAKRGIIRSADIVSGAYKDKWVEFEGETTMSLASSSYLYIYILDQIYYSGTEPRGYTKTSFNDDDFEVSLELPYTAVTAPGAESISINGEKPTQNSPIEVYRDTKLTLRWGEAGEGSNNPVSGYKIYYGISGQSYSQSLTVGNVTNYSFVVSEKFGGPRKGTTFYLGVQALATYGDLHSEIVTLGYVKVINKAPEKPSFSTSGVIRINEGFTSDIEITNLICKDVDDDALVFYYVTNNSETVSPSDASKAEVLPSDYTIEMDQKNSHLHIRAKEENSNVYGEWATLKVLVNTEPDFKFSVTANLEDQRKSINGEKTFVRKITADCGFEKLTSKITSYTWSISKEGAWNTFDSITTSKRIIESINPVESGEKIKLKLKIQDEAGDVFEKECDTEYYRAYLVKPILDSVKPADDVIAITNENGAYLGRKAVATITVNLPGDDIARTLAIYQNDQKINLELKNGQQDYQFITRFFESDSDSAKFKAELSSDGFINSQSSELDKTYYRLPYFEIEKGGFNVNVENWRPIKQNAEPDLGGSEPEEIWFTALYSSSNDYGRNYYTLKANYTLKGKDKEIYLFTQLQHQGAENDFEKWYACADGSPWSSQRAGDTINFKIDSLELLKIFEGNGNSIINELRNSPVTYTMIGYNAYKETGETNNIKCEKKITTQEAPYFITGASLKATIDNGVNNSSEYSTWFNPGEKVTFDIISPSSNSEGGSQPKAFQDYNDFAIGDLKESSYSGLRYEICYKEVGQTTWLGVLQTGIIYDEQTKGYVSQIIIDSMPDLTNNGTPRDIEFGLFLIDETKLKSNNSLTSTLFACRATNANLNIVSGQEDQNQLTLKLNFADFGGNDNGKENFTRNGGETYDINLYINADNSENFTTLSAVEGKPLEDLQKESTINVSLEETGLSSQGKLYIKVEFVACTNIVGNSISTRTKVFLVYLNSPTMSHRAHWIGINTTKNNKEDVFHVTSFDERGIIRLEGADREAQTIAVLIDLNKGQMYIDKENGLNIDFKEGTVKNALISGGSW